MMIINVPLLVCYQLICRLSETLQLTWRFVYLHSLDGDPCGEQQTSQQLSWLVCHVTPSVHY